jgi:4-amino-4-deoxy-L-arabinose transferase-like glycosyltransferase
MNRLLKVILALSLPIVAVVILLLNTRSGEPDLRQQAVLSYVFFRRTILTQPLTVRQYLWASMPQNFHAKMSGDSYGNARYYQTAHRFGQTAQPHPTFPLTATLPPTLTWSGYLSGMPIPYPPTDLWCVELSSPDPAAPQVVLVALHQDIYNAEWIVHAVTDPAAVLPIVGCQFSRQ